MGNIQANQTRQVMSEFTEFVNNNATNIANQNELNCTADNYVTFSTGQGPDCDFVITNGEVNINQSAFSNCKISAENVNDVQVDIQNNMANTIEQFADQASESTQGWLATAFSFQINNAENITQLSNTIQNSIQTDVDNFCGSELLSSNNAVVNLCGTFNGSTFNITQDAFATGVASCVNKNLVSAFTTNDTLNEVFQRTDQELASKQEGIGSLFFWLAIAGGILLLLLIIGLIAFFFLRGSGGDGNDGITIALEPDALEMQPPYYQNMNGALESLSTDVV